MKVKDIVPRLGLDMLSGDADREISGCYVGDLLSWVMSHAQFDECWITIMSNINVVAVASLTDVACVIIAEGARPEENVIEAAKAKGVCLLLSEETVFSLADEMAGLLKEKQAE